MLNKEVINIMGFLNDVSCGLLLPADLGEERRPVPKAYDGQAGGLRSPLCHLPRHVYQHQRNWYSHGACLGGAHLVLAGGRQECREGLLVAQEVIVAQVE